MGIRTAVIGVGHLGKQHARIHAALALEDRLQFLRVCDIDPARGAEIANQFNVSLCSDWRDLIGSVDAVSLAVPTEAHAEIAGALLAAGIHCLGHPVAEQNQPVSRAPVD